MKILSKELEIEQEEMLNSSNPEEIVSFAIEHQNDGIDLESLKIAVIHSGNAYSCYEFAKSVKLNDVSDLQRVIETNREDKLFADFASNVEGANIASLQDILIEEAEKELNKEDDYINGCIEKCLEFAIDVDGADVEALQDVILKSEDAFLCYQFALHVKGADIYELESVVENDANPKLCYMFARDIKQKCNITGLRNVVFRSGNEELINKFKQDVLFKNAIKNEEEMER